MSEGMIYYDESVRVGSDIQTRIKGESCISRSWSYNTDANVVNGLRNPLILYRSIDKAILNAAACLIDIIYKKYSPLRKIEFG